MRAVSVGFEGSGSSDNLLERGLCRASGFSSASLENYSQPMGHAMRKKWHTSEEAAGMLGLQKTTSGTGGWGSSGNGKLACSLYSFLKRVTGHLLAKMVRWCDATSMLERLSLEVRMYHPSTISRRSRLTLSLNPGRYVLRPPPVSASSGQIITIAL